MKTLLSTTIIALGTLVSTMPQISMADGATFLGGSSEASPYSSSELHNAILCSMDAGNPPVEPLPAYQSDDDKAKADPDKARAYAMELIRVNKNNCVLDLYRQEGITNNALFLAIQKGDLEMTEALINQGSSLQWGDVHSNSFFFRGLLKKKDANVDACVALLLAAQAKAGDVIVPDTLYDTLVITGPAESETRFDKQSAAAALSGYFKQMIKNAEVYDATKYGDKDSMQVSSPLSNIYSISLSNSYANQDKNNGAQYKIVERSFSAKGAKVHRMYILYTGTAHYVLDEEDIKAMQKASGYFFPAMK